MDEMELWAAVVAAGTELRIAQGELAEAELEDSAFATLDELKNRVAAAAVVLERAKRRWSNRSSGSPSEF